MSNTRQNSRRTVPLDRQRDDADRRDAARRVRWSCPATNAYAHSYPASGRGQPNFRGDHGPRGAGEPVAAANARARFARSDARHGGRTCHAGGVHHADTGRYKRVDG